MASEAEKLANEFCTAIENPEQVQTTMNYLADHDSKPVTYAYKPPEGTRRSGNARGGARGRASRCGRWCFFRE
jgi:hypothetical protein